MLSESEQVTNPYAMNPEVKAQWLTALRSGEYKQGRGNLGTKHDIKPDEFCCLGVLCDLAVKEGVIKPPKVVDDSYHYDERSAFLPGQVAEWAGVEREGRFGISHAERLVYANDEDRLTFEQIADVIERKL